MDMMEARRRMLMANERPRYLGTSDFSLQNVTVYQDSSKYQYLDIYLLKEEMPFTILMDCQVINGYSESGTIALDFLSGGQLERGNFVNGLGIRHYGVYYNNYLFNQGPYIQQKNDYDAHKFVMRYDPSKDKNVKGWIDSNAYEKSVTFIQSDNPLHIGGRNYQQNSDTGYGVINELMIYYHALDDTDILGYINNGIIP